MEKTAQHRSILILCLLGVYFLFSCSTEQIEEQPARMCKSKKEAYPILIQYLELQGNTYVLNINKENAYREGVPTIFYDSIKIEVQNTNDVIQKLKDSQDTELILLDPKDEILKGHQKDLLWGTTKSMSIYGSLTTFGQEEAFVYSLWAPMGTKGLSFSCRANAAFTPIFTCKTYSSGTWRGVTSVGFMGGTVEIPVPLYVSNDYVGASFQTSDSNGGSAYYRGYDSNRP